MANILSENGPRSSIKASLSSGTHPCTQLQQLSLVAAVEPRTMYYEAAFVYISWKWRGKWDMVSFLCACCSIPLWIDADSRCPSTHGVRSARSSSAKVLDSMQKRNKLGSTTLQRYGHSRCTTTVVARSKSALIPSHVSTL